VAQPVKTALILAILAIAGFTYVIAQSPHF
jgi:hypothetical protein